MSSEIKKLGIIAGGGLLPRYIAEHCTQYNIPYIVLGLDGFVDPEFLNQHPHKIHNMGQIGHALDDLKSENVTHITMGGTVGRPSLSSLKLDFTGMKLMGKIAMLKTHGDDALLSFMLNFFEKEGFTVVRPDTLVTNLAIPAGTISDKKPSEVAEEDIRIGLTLLKALGSFDVGQAAIVQQKRIIAIEAAEGTAAMIERAAPLLLDGDKATLIKIKKPGQDMRADMPAIGPDTVAQAQAAGLGGIAIEANATLVLDQQNVIASAKKSGLFVTAVDL